MEPVVGRGGSIDRSLLSLRRVCLFVCLFVNSVSIHCYLSPVALIGLLVTKCRLILRCALWQRYSILMGGFCLEIGLSKAQRLLYVPPGVTSTNYTFCPHSVFMCFVWISGQTTIISLYSINWLVFITETECIYCAVRTGSLNVTQVNIRH
jgi:hypothetical protein